jgi:hypothetical protein
MQNAFSGDALVAVGGSDPRVRIALDDIDVRWRQRAILLL